MKSWKEKIRKITSKSVASSGGGGGPTAWADLTGSPTDNAAFDSLYSDLVDEDVSLANRTTALEEVVWGTPVEELAELDLVYGQLLYQNVGGLAPLTLGAGLSLSGGVLSAPGGGGGSPTTLEDLDDVLVDSPALGEFLRYDGDFWENYALGLGDFPEINLDDIEEGQGLLWDGVNSTLSAADLVRGSGKLMVYSGLVLADGTGSGEGWTISKMGTGDYRLNFSPPLPNIPNVGVEITPETAGDFRVTQVHSSSETSVRILTADLTGALVDARFIFAAIVEL